VIPEISEALERSSLAAASTTGPAQQAEAYGTGADRARSTWPDQAS
jgi:hypothetical protein